MNKELQIRLRVLAERVDTLSLRERALTFIAVMVVLYLVAVNVVFGPLRAEQARLEADVKAKREQIHAADRQVESIAGGSAKDVNGENRARAESLRHRLRELDAQTDEMTAGVVSPQEMAKLVEQMLTRNRGLELVKLENLPAMPVGQDAPRAGASSTPADVVVYRHGMRVEFRGRYFEIVEYLKALEGLPWKVFWGEVTLETEKYPLSKVSLVIYTLSRHPGWIGV